MSVCIKISFSKQKLLKIEEFCDITVFKLLRKKKVNQLFYYKKILLLLKKIQEIKMTGTTSLSMY